METERPVAARPVLATNVTAKMKFVKQRHERDCLVACAAMLADLSYEKVWRDQRSGFSEEEIFHFRAMHWLFYFSHLGFEVGRLYLEDSSQLDRTSTFPTGVRYLRCFGLDESHPKAIPKILTRLPSTRPASCLIQRRMLPGPIHQSIIERGLEDIAYRIC
jgi:hypothetical protein